MAIKILGIDVSDKSTEELHHIVETLGLRDLSEKSMNKLARFPEEMRREWIENPDTTGAFTNDSVRMLSKSLSVESDKIDEKKIYSPAFAETIHDLDKKAYDAACGSYESSIDRQAAHYDIFFDSIKASGLNVTNKELDLLCEMVAMGNYDTDREKFISSNISKTGGKFVIVQPEGLDDDDIGSKLHARTEDIECVVGDELGLDEMKGKHLFITPTIPAAHFGDKASFAVYYTNFFGKTDAMKADAEIKNALLEEVQTAGYDASKFEVGPSFPADKSEITSLQTEDAEKIIQPSSLLSPEAIHELEHAQSVINHCFDDDGYNEDEYDATGHSRDGDYNPMYDQAFTDQGDGPDL